MKRSAPFLIVAVVALLAFAAGVMLYRGYQQKVVAQTEEQQEASRRGGLHARGNPKSPVTIEEFGDFQCPPCGALSDPLNKVVDDYKGKVRLVFREFPLINHQFARPAAYAAEAAGFQGKFWEMHDLLYKTQVVWTKAADPAPLFSNYAKMLGLDQDRFEQDWAGKEVNARVVADQKRAAELGVSLTPTVFVNGKSIAGPAHNPQGIRDAIEKALAAIPATKN